MWYTVLTLFDLDVPESKIILGTSLEADTIREGTDVYFDCIINAHPPVYKVEWRHNVCNSNWYFTYNAIKDNDDY